MFRLNTTYYVAGLIIQLGNQATAGPAIGCCLVEQLLLSFFLPLIFFLDFEKFDIENKRFTRADISARTS